MPTLIGLLTLTNQILTSAIVILGFSLLLYSLTHNLRERVARAFSLLLGFVVVVYLGDVGAGLVADPTQVMLWLRFQWIGIAFVPAAYLHLSDALLATTNDRSARRRVAARLAYLVSALFLAAALFTNWVVDGVVFPPSPALATAPHLDAGPLFWLFTLYFYITVGWGAYNLYRARERSLTPTMRRRMTYLLAASAAPAAGVYPYMLVASYDAFRTPTLFWLVSIAGNLAVAAMLTVMAYVVAYFGVLTPDRVVRARLVKFLVRGPFVATVTLVAVIAVRRTTSILGLPSDIASLFTMVAVILLLQWAIVLFKPALERLLYFEERAEMRRIQKLEDRLLTTRDLHQFLESVLAAVCEQVRAPSAFVAAITETGPRLEVTVGHLPPPGALPPLAEWGAPQANGNGQPALSSEREVGLEEGAPSGPALRPQGDLFLWDGYWLVPLHNMAGTTLLGVLGVAVPAQAGELSPDSLQALRTLAAQAAMALEDRLLQQDVFAAVEGLLPSIEALQRRRGAAQYGGADLLTSDDILKDPDYVQFVRDALNHYWGGPKLAESPLLRLKVVEQALQENDGNAVRALRSVLLQAIERLKPEGQQKLTAGEWILYNILEMKFLQGRRVRDIAMRLAMSESDLYRKQRIAIESVARAIAEMEQAAQRQLEQEPGAGRRPEQRV